MSEGESKPECRTVGAEWRRLYQAAFRARRRLERFAARCRRAGVRTKSKKPLDSLDPRSENCPRET